MSNPQPRMLIIANKAWEADPLTYVLSAAPSAVPETNRPRPDSVLFVRSSGTRGLRGLVASPRFQIEAWCLEELMPDGVSKSNSFEKAQALTPLLADPAIALVVAFGTAASSPAFGIACLSGCVVIGTNAFVHDFKSPKTKPLWVPPAPDQLLPSTFQPRDFWAFVQSDAYRAAVESRLLTPPLHPAGDLRVLAGPAYVALSDVNVSDPADYGTADKAAYAAYLALREAEPLGSLETTHGVMRSCTLEGTPFMFVSGIVNRAYAFMDDVSQRPYSQNFVGAHNAAIAVAFAIPALAGHP